MGLRTLDLFCGAGGSSWGAKAAGATMACGVDAWEIATATYKRNFPHAHAVQRALSEHSSADILGDVGQIDLLLASPECTNHTCAKGAGPRNEKSRRTARYVLNFARALQPRWMVLENVVQMRNWHGYDPLIGQISKIGYHVSTQVLDAADFGVPQTRRRLFILCDRRRMPAEVRICRRGPRASAKAILDTPGTWRARPLYDGVRAEQTLARAGRAIQALGRSMPFLVVYYGSDGAGGWQPLDKPLRTLTTLDRFGLVTWDGRMPLLRMLQVPELQRAMGFDDYFRLDYGVRRDKIRLLGNGVCPPVMRAVVETLVEGGTASL